MRVCVDLVFEGTKASIEVSNSVSVADDRDCRGALSSLVAKTIADAYKTGFADPKNPPSNAQISISFLPD